jgi:hypothetical protein
MQVINSIIEYFRGLAESHKLIKGFKTGEAYESNAALQSYPILWVRLPLTTNYSAQGSNDIDDYLYITLNVAVYTTIYTDSNGNNYTVTETITKKPANEIGQTEPLVVNSLLEVCYQIYNHIQSKFILDIEEGNVPAIAESFSNVTVERVWNDDVYGIEGTMTFKWYNTYKCELDDYFIDSLENEKDKNNN